MGTGRRGNRMKVFLRQLVHNGRGATAIEYGIIMGLIAVALVASMHNVAGKTTSMWGNVSTEVLNH
jgi:pilus assembly protein Flp/PilA